MLSRSVAIRTTAPNSLREAAPPSGHLDLLSPCVRSRGVRVACKFDSLEAIRAERAHHSATARAWALAGFPRVRGCSPGLRGGGHPDVASSWGPADPQQRGRDGPADRR